MTSKYQSRQAFGGGVRDEVEGLEPMSLSSQCINTSVFSLRIIGVCESEIPIDQSKIMAALRRDLLPVNHHFSCIIVTDDKGVQWWKKVEVRFEDHVVIPTFPENLSPETYEKQFEEYLAKIALDRLPENRPLWEMHIFKYPTCNAAGSLALKMHHSLGDGFSLMGALFSCLKRADDPSLPLTFPTSSSSSSKPCENMNICKRVLSLVSGCWNTASDFFWGFLRSTLMEDSHSAIRSGTPQVENMPIDITSVTFSLDDIRRVKSHTGGSVNDVMVGIVFYGIHLYTHAMDQISNGSRKTALVLLNTRMLNGYRSVEEMLEKDMWGNQFSFIHVSVPSYSDGEMVDPLKFVFDAKKTIKRNRNSMGIYLNGALLRMVGMLKGTQAVSQYLHSTSSKASMTISNLVGPTEKMVIADHPINSLYFTVAGGPQSLFISIMSYMGKLRMVALMEKEFINSHLLVSCMNKAFKRILDVACEID